MTKKLLDAVKQQKKSTQPSELEILGSVGALINGQKVVEVPNRNSFIYIRLQDNSNEIIQAFNNQVSPSYNLPVKLVWKDNRYIVLGVDTARYQNNWPSFAPYLPRHGTQHSFSEPPGGDIAWIYSKQFMPMLPTPSGSNGAAQVIINSSVYRHPDGTWDFIGAAGTPDLTLPKPTDSQARMLLLYWDLSADAPAALTGSFFASSITGTSQVLDYLPTTTDSTKVPLAGIRLVSGTSVIGWDNIYDVRQFAVNVPPAFAGGFGIWEEGIPQGTGTILNFVGNEITATVSGTVARILVTASAGGGGDSVWTTGTAGTLSITTRGSTNDSRGNRALSHGNNTLALAANDHSEGSGSIASGTNSHAEGQSTLTRGQASHAEGISTKAVGQASHAEGTDSIASGSYSHAEGEGNIAYGWASHVAGGFNEGRGTYSAIIAGALNSLVGDYSSILAGQGITGSADNTAYTDYMNVRNLGTGTSIQNVGIDAEGFLVPGTAGGGSGAERFWTSGTAGIQSVRTIGGGGDATGDYALSAGRLNTAAGDASAAFGQANSVAGNYSLGVGFANTVSGSNSAVIAGITHRLYGGNSSVISGEGITGSADNTAYADYLNIRRLGSPSPILTLARSLDGTIVTGTALVVPVADSGGYFTGTNTEAVLQELAVRDVQQLFTNGLNVAVPASSTRYLAPVFDSGLATAVFQIATGRACIIEKIIANTGGTQPATGSLVLTVLKNGVATSMAITIAAGSGSGANTDSSTSNPVTLADEDSFGWQLVNNATSNSRTIRAFTMIVRYTE